MGFVVLPALAADISAVYNVYFAAFKDNAITRALFPSATAEDFTSPESDFRYVTSEGPTILGDARAQWPSHTASERMANNIQ